MNDGHLEVYYGRAGFWPLSDNLARSVGQVSLLFCEYLLMHLHYTYRVSHLCLTTGSRAVFKNDGGRRMP